MTTFRIDTENNITAFASGEQIRESAGETETFSSRQELTTVAEKWPAARLVEIWNGLTELVTFVVAENQSVEVAGAGRVSADHEFLASIDAHLLPGAGAHPRLVAAI